MRGTSVGVDGIYGLTTAASTPTQFFNGVHGVDRSKQTNEFNDGVEGDSVFGTGVFGTTANTNPLSTALQAGVGGFDINANPSTDANVGVLGFSGFVGGAGLSGSGIGLFGISQHGAGMIASAENSDGVGLIVTNRAGGVLMIAHNGATNKDVMSLDGKGNMILAGTLKQHGTPLAVTHTSGGGDLIASVPRQTQATIEDFGEAQLIGGRAYVRLDPAFASTIDASRPYFVFITPQGDNRGLYVTQRSASGFAVRESQAGRSTLAFDYRIVAKPFDANADRLPAVAPMAADRFTTAMEKADRFIAKSMLASKRPQP
jgi:hypothetical protein